MGSGGRVLAMDREHASSGGDSEGTFWARGREGLSRVKRHLWQDAREDEGEDCGGVGAECALN